MVPSFVFVGVIVVFALYAIGVFNRLVTLRNLLKNAFSQIDVQLKRRHDLIPNLVETAKGYLAHERGTLEAVIAARTRAVAATDAAAKNPNAASIKAVSSAESALVGSLGRLMVLTETYPELKANQTMTALAEELTSTENKVAFARQAFNDGVAMYNIALERFPASLLAGSFGFEAAPMFEIERPEEREPVRVAFG